MKVSRRKLLSMAAGSFPLLSHAARAADYPTRPVRLVLGLPPGGSVDLVTRIIAQLLSDYFRQQFIFDNRPGAAGDIATDAVVNSPPDGHTLLVVLAANAINATLHQKLRFSPVRDLELVAGLVRVPNVMEINPDGYLLRRFPSSSCYAKANPGKLNYASSGTGQFTSM